MLEAALALLAQGRSVFPVRIERTDRGFSKTPLSLRPMDRRFTEAELRALWPAEANGIGMELGAVSGVVRLDAEGPVPWTELGEQPACGLFSTPSGGQGWLIEHSPGIRSDRVWKGEGHAELKLMSDGLYTVVPPSEGYKWLIEGIAPLPDWLLERQAERALTELAPPTFRCDTDPCEVQEALQHVSSDDRDTWLGVGMALKLLGEQYLPIWEEWSRGSPKFVEGECEQLWGTFRPEHRGRCLTVATVFHWARQNGWQPTRTLHEPITELGNARMLARLGAGRIAHSSEWGWLAYDGGTWRRRGDAEKVVQEIQKDVLRLRMDAAVRSLARHLQGDKSAEDYNKKAKSKLKTIAAIRAQEDARSIAGARKLAESEPQLTCNYKDFDKDVMLLNCLNCTIDLRNRESRDHSSADRLTQQCPTAYDPAAVCPRWDRFLREVFDGDEALIAYIQRLLGYCITGSVTQHVLPVWYGTGRNGKSTIIRAILATLGPDYAGTAPPCFLVESWSKAHPTEIADLYGKRFVADLETGDGVRLDEEKVKRLTGGDELTARRMREDFWRFTPTHKLVLATNYEPTVRGQDVAIWSRIQKVPFNVSFYGREEHGLDDTLAAEAPGILRWLVEGCYEWQDRGLSPPAAVVAATEEYRTQENTVVAFFREMLVLGSAEQRTLKNVVTTAYRAWCELRGAKPVNPKTFGSELKKLNVSGDHNYYHVSIVRS